MTAGENSPGVFLVTVSPPMRWSSRSSGTPRSARVPVRSRTSRSGPLVRARLGDVGNLDRLARHGHAPDDALAPSDRRAPGHRDHLLVEVVGGAEEELLGPLVVLVDGARRRCRRAGWRGRRSC